jgi:hypothetical protein
MEEDKDNSLIIVSSDSESDCIIVADKRGS